MARRHIHFIAPAGSLRTYLEHLSLTDSQSLVALIQETVGPDYGVTADLTLLSAVEDEARGGRTDDVARARDIERSLADDRVAAIIALRGGAWLSRVLPRIDFGVLDHRERPVAMIGFSELTTLVNIVGAHRHGLGLYDISPAFLSYGLRRYALTHAEETGGFDEVKANDWMRRRVHTETSACFSHFVAMIEGRETCEPLSCRLVRGSLPESVTATFVGGNLTVFSTLIGSRFEPCVNPAGRWIVIEDFNDRPERLDRFLAHLTLAGYWDRCAGVLLGDFHHRGRNIRPLVLAMLDYHLPAGGTVPVLTTDRIGHRWPMSPFPLHRPLNIRRCSDVAYTIGWPANVTGVV